MTIKNYFSKQWKVILSILLLFLTTLLLSVAHLDKWFVFNKKNSISSEIKFAKPSIRPVEPIENINTSPPENFISQLEKASALPILTPERIAEEKKMDEEQVKLAQQWLESSDPEQRLTGAEQLSAYPTDHAETLLVKALTNDPDPQVRGSAARSLEFIESPKNKTLNTLLNQLNDRNEEVRISVLNTLEANIEREPFDSMKSRKILRKLRQAAKSRQIPKGTRKSIQDFLNERSLEE